MSFTAPYKQQNYMGEHADDSAALTFIRTVEWDSNKDGTGDPESGMLYYNTGDNALKLYTGSSWEEMSAGAAPNLSAVLSTGNTTNGNDLTVSDGDTLTISADGGSGGSILSIAGVANVVSGGTLAVADGGALTIADLTDCTFTGTPTSPTDPVNKAYVDSVAQGLDWQDSVLDRYDPTGGTPVGPSAGDRYIATATANGWTENNIYEWDGVSTWDETVADEGMACWVEDEDKLYVYSGSTWVTFGSTIDHGNLSGLQGGTSSEYYHLTSAQHTGLTGGGDTSLHTHDGRYYTETELGSTTSSSEGATLIGTADLSNLGSPANVQLALEAADSHVGSSSNPHSVTLDQAYDGGANANIAVDAYDVDWQLAGTSYAFKVTSTNDSVSFTGDGAGNIAGVMNLASLDVDTAGAFSLDAGAASHFTVAAANLTISTTTSGTIAVNSAGAVEVDATGAIGIESSGGKISIGGDAVDQNISIGTDGNREISIGNGIGTGSVSIQAGTGGIGLTADSGNLTLSTTTSGNVILSAAGSLVFSDGNKAGSTYDTDLVLSDASGEWDTFETNFGEVSLLNAINQAYSAVTEDYWNRVGTVLSPQNSGDSLAIVIDDTENAIVATFTQADVTNNPDVVEISNAGSGDSLVLSGAGTRSIVSDNANLSISTTTSGHLSVNAAGTLALGNNASSTVTVGGNATTTTTIGNDAATSVTIRAGGTAGNGLTVNASGVALSASTGDLALSCAAGDDITITAANNAASDVIFGAHSGTVTLNSTSNTGITGFTDNTITGAIAELQGRVKTNAGNPNSSVSGNEGDICIDTTNDVAYINVDGTSTGWAVIG